MKKILTEGFFYSIICLVFSRTQRNARVAQLVECDLAKVEAAGSSPVLRFFLLPQTRKNKAESIPQGLRINQPLGDFYFNSYNSFYMLHR